MIENWRNLVGVEIVSDANCKVKHLNVAYKPDSKNSELEFKITDTPVVCNMSEEQLVEQLDLILTSFTNICKNDPISINRAKTASVIKSKRGMPNTAYKNAMYYKGNVAGDSPIIVGDFNGKYGIFKHPNFDNYGFLIETTE